MKTGHGTCNKREVKIMVASGLLNLDNWEEGMSLTEVISVGRRVQIRTREV